MERALPVTANFVNNLLHLFTSAFRALPVLGEEQDARELNLHYSRAL